MRALLVLLLASCAHQPVCVSKCGMVGVNVNCAELQETETRALDAYARHHIIDKARACKLLRGWSVEVHHSSERDIRPFLKECAGVLQSRTCSAQCQYPAWRGTGDLETSCLAGYTYVEDRLMEVAEPVLPQSALVHEMMHALDHARGKPLGHCRWTERGIKQAIFEATSMIDDNDEPCP